MFENWQKLVSSNKIDLVQEKITYYSFCQFSNMASSGLKIIFFKKQNEKHPSIIFKSFQLHVRLNLVVKTILLAVYV